MADRIGIMNNGKLKALGTVDEILKITNKTKFEDAFLSLTDTEVE